MPDKNVITLSDIERKERAKLHKWLHERTAMACGFSYAKLHRLLSKFMEEDEIPSALQDCILHFGDGDGKKAAEKSINKEISSILMSNVADGIRFEDPFARKMSCSIFESTSPPHLSGDKMLEIGPSIDVSTEQVLKLIELATVPGSSYAAVRIVAVKEKE